MALLPHNNSEPTLTAGHRLASGTIHMLAAQAFNMLLGIVTAALLTRGLGPELFGLFALTGTVFTWFEIVAIRTLNRTSIKLIADAGDWQATASRIFQIYFVLGLIAAAVMFSLAPVISSLLRADALMPYLRILSLQMPLTAFVKIYEATLIGTKRFGYRAVIMAVHSAVRLVLVYVLLTAGFSLTGALLASIGAVAGQVLVARLFVRLPLRIYLGLPWRQFTFYAIPLALYTIASSLYQQLDIVMVQALSADTRAAGYYGAAKSLMTMPGMVSVAFAPLLLSTLSTLWQEGDRAGAGLIVGHTLRLHLLMLPFISLAAGSAAEIVVFLYGEAFQPAAPLLAWLLFGGLASMLHSTMTSGLAAVGRPRTTFLLTGPLIPAAVALHLILIPRLGPLGAAITSTALLATGGISTLALLVYSVGAKLPLLSLARTGAIGAAAFWLGQLSQRLLPAAGILLVGKLAVLCALLIVILFVSAELKMDDVRFVLSVGSGNVQGIFNRRRQ